MKSKTTTNNRTITCDRYVTYIRVSSNKQGVSGLGLEAQQASVRSYVEAHGGDELAEYVEVESGRKNNRPELAKALAFAKKHKATLLIANISRLARNVHFISGLMESKLDFVAVDMPTASRLTLHIISAVNEEQARVIGVNTSNALQALKARGVKLGLNGKVLAKDNKAESARFAKDLTPTILELKSRGITSQQKVCDELNRLEIPTAKGGRWHKTTVGRLLKKVA